MVTYGASIQAIAPKRTFVSLDSEVVIDGLDTTPRTASSEEDRAKVSEEELRHRGTLLIDGIKLDASHLPGFEVLVTFVARMFGISKPQIFLNHTSHLRFDARSVGTKHQACVALSTELVEAFTPEQLLAVLGHEFGHLVLDHDVLRTTDERTNGADTRRRDQQRELAADRFALLACQDLETFQRVLIMLQTQSVKFLPSIETYLTDHLLSLEYHPNAVQYADRSTHPFTAARIKAAQKFFEGPYQQIIERHGVQLPATVQRSS